VKLSITQIVLGSFMLAVGLTIPFSISSPSIVETVYGQKIICLPEGQPYYNIARYCSWIPALLAAAIIIAAYFHLKNITRHKVVLSSTQLIASILFVVLVIVISIWGTVSAYRGLTSNGEGLTVIINGEIFIWYMLLKVLTIFSSISVVVISIIQLFMSRKKVNV
jgi:hypothetical protein